MSVQVHGSLARRLRVGRMNMPFTSRMAAERASSSLKRHVQRRTPVRSGALRASIEELPVRKIGPNLYRTGVQSKLSYASYVEDGTRPHQIDPRVGGVLAFFWQGKMRFYQNVSHPGTAPVKMFQKGVIAERRSIRGRLRRIFFGWKVESGL